MENIKSCTPTPKAGIVERLTDRRSHLAHCINKAQRINDKLFVGDDVLKGGTMDEKAPETSVDGIVEELYGLCNELESILQRVDDRL